MDSRDTNIGEIEGDTAASTEADSKAKTLAKEINILKDFYSNALVQTRAGFVPEGAGADGQTVGDLAPDAGTEEYHGNQDAASGIMGMLDVIMSDFENTIAKTEEAETEEDDEYKAYKEETEGSISKKEGLIKTKESEKKTELGNKADANDDLKDHTAAKEEALAELSKLKPACVDTGSDYAEKVARREQEIESLKNAYVILDEMR